MSTLGKRKHRILFIDHGAKLVGGGQVNILSFIRYMDKCRFEPIVLTSKENSFTSGARRLGVRVEIMPFPDNLTSAYRSKLSLGLFKIFGYLIGTMTLVIRLNRFVRLNKIDLIHPCDNVSRVAGGLVARMRGIPTVCHITDDLDDAFANRILRYIILHTMDAILPVSNKVAEFFKVAGAPLSKVRVVFTGIDFNYFNKSIPYDGFAVGNHVDENIFTIGIIGMLVPIKGHRELFQALSRLKCVISKPLACLVVGDGPDRTFLEKYASNLEIADQVTFTGNRTDIPAILALLDVLVVPSHTEASSRVVLEAAAMAVPSIGTRVGGIPEMIEENQSGLLVPLGDIDALVNALVTMVDERVRRRMGDYAYKRVRERFDNQKITTEIEQIYTNLLMTAA